MSATNRAASYAIAARCIAWSCTTAPIDPVRAIRRATPRSDAARPAAATPAPAVNSSQIAPGERQAESVTVVGRVDTPEQREAVRQTELGARTPAIVGAAVSAAQLEAVEVVVELQCDVGVAVVRV